MIFLETKRIYLRDLEEKDTDMLYELHNNQKTMRYMHYNTISYEKAKHDIKDYSSVSELQPGYGIWATVLKDSDEVIGWTCLKKLPNSNDVEIGYRYFPKYWNKGYCTEICNELIRYGFEERNLIEIIALIRPDNLASIRVVEKLKMSYVKMVTHFGMNLKQFSLTKDKYFSNKSTDVYGSALMDYYHGDFDKMSSSWLSSSKHYFTTYEEWFPREQKAIQYATGRVLDIGCAAGRHSLYLQANGLDVTGIDNSAKSIEICRSRGLRKAEVLSLHDIPSNYGTFDTIMMLGNHFGLVGTMNKALNTLKMFNEITSDNGVLILGASGLHISKLSSSFKEQIENNRKNGRYIGEVTYHLTYNDLSSDLDWLCIEKEDIIKLINKSNFYVDTIIEDDMYGEPYPYVIIAKKHTTN